MRILNLIPTLSGGGAERQLSYLSQELLNKGHEIHIAYVHVGVRLQKPEFVKLHVIKTKSNYNPVIIWELIKLIRQIKPDIIQTWITQMDVFGGIATQICGVPWILREPSSILNYPDNWKNKLRISVAARAKAIVSNSVGGDHYWKSYFPKSNRIIIRNGVPLTEIENISPSWPSSFDPKGQPVILYVGRLTSDATASKNLKVLIIALSKITKNKPAKLILCGEGPQRNELEELSLQLGIKDHVFFAGHLSASNVWALMKKADAFVSLSNYEGCPNSVMEAMVCECPLIVSDIQAHREILDEKSALFVRQGDADEVAIAITKCLERNDSTSMQVWDAKQKIRKFSVEKMAEQYLSLYNNCIAE